MKEMKRILSFLLCFVMVLGLFPAGILTVEAAGETIYVLAGGDFQEAGDHANSAENVTNILAQVSQKYQTMDGFLFIGDYDCETHDSSTETANGITALMGAVQGKYSNLNDANSVLVQGNHDYMDSRIDATGGHEFDGYAAYVLNEDDYPNGGGSQSGIQTLANNLKTWLNNKIGEGYTAPIFVVSHLPLAFTPRTVTQGDAKYAKYIFDVLNDAGANGLNIIFLHGHDHAYGPDNYMGGEAIYLPKGDKICIAEAGSTSAWTEETLSFTYMNAGYTGYYSDPYTYVTTAGTDKLTMTVFAITDNEVTVERYSANGQYNLKSAGYDGSYSNTSVTNTSLGLPTYSAVYASPQTIALEANELAGEATIGNWVGIEAETPADDVTTSNKGWVELVAPVHGTTTGGTTVYNYTWDTNGKDNDTAYLIVNGTSTTVLENNGTSGVTTATITSNDGTTATASTQDYEWKIDSSNRVYTTIDGTTYYLNRNYRGSLELTTSSSVTKWTITNNNGEYTISYTVRFIVSTTYYLTTSGLSTTPGTVRLYYADGSTTTGGTTTEDVDGTYGKIVGDLTYNATVGMTADEAMALVKAGVDGYYYNGMSTPGSDVTGTIVDDSTLTWEWVDTFDGNTAGDYEVAIKYGDFLLGTAEVVVPAATTYYIAEGNGLYLVDMNTTADNAMAAVKAGVTVYSATDANGTNKTAISDDDVTWNWVDTYNGADSGPYTVEILKDGESLGTVEVKVNVKYETGINSDWTYIGETEATGGTYTYTLDTDGIDYGEENKYIIVAADQALALHANSSSNGTAESITISGNTATTTTRDYEYHFIQTSYNGTRYELITKGDGSSYLYQQDSGVRYGTRSSVKFQINHHGNGVYDVHDIDGTNWYLIYNGSWTVVEDTSARVRLYKYTGMTGGTSAGSIYAKIEGNTVYTVEQGTSATQAMAAVKAGITGYLSSNADGTDATELADSALTWKWKNTYASMVTGSYWVEISYQGKVLGTVEVKVEPGVINNYPEYPDEGSVKVSKTGTGIDFQSSGIAQVEISASGVPIKKGADVIIMLDTSSSMAYCLNCSNTRHSTYVCDQGGQTRAQALEETLGDLITQFKTPGDDGQVMDIDVAIADFNGFYGDSHSESGTPYDRDAADMMSDDISYTANSAAQVYTNGTGALDATAFVAAEDLAATYDLSYASGTNYDYAFDAIYQMATAKKIANGSEERDLYVIFMSDGAGMQWNYYHSQGASSLWNSWITGAWSANEVAANLNCTTHAYYYDETDHDGDGYINEHRMANAIKGDPSETFEVIRKTGDLGTATGEGNMYMVPGLGAKLFSIAYDPRVDTNVTVDSITKSIASLASDQTGTTQYFYNVSSADELASAFTAIGSEIAYAAYNARFVDQMGDDYDLVLGSRTYSVVDGETTTSKTQAQKIEILSYDIYTKAEADAVAEGTEGDTVTNSMIGDRKGTFTVIETVTFNTDGTEAYSTLNSTGPNGETITARSNILIDGVIYANTFWYNTNATDKAITGVDIPTGVKSDGTTTGSTNVLPSETFYWKLGTVTTSELAMRYYVYLEGSMEGTREAGSYPTNEYATLYYDNYLENPCYKDTVSPVLAWEEANVSYAFYLVNEKGEIIVNQTTGQTGSFANKIAVTNPVVYETIKLNNLDEVSSIEVASSSEGILPAGYELYDTASVYTIRINSNTTGSWEIVKSTDKVASTYVTQFDPDDASAYSSDLLNGVDENGNTVVTGNDYTHTVVWFAVLWKVQALPDTVVIDYGLPVDISVLTNDMFGENGKLAGVGATTTEGVTLDGYTADNKLPSTTYTGTYGSATADTTTGKVRYQVKDMQMKGYEKFAYAVNYTGTTNPGYYYDTVTVIPATTIYYEDSFVTLNGYEWDYNANPATWKSNDNLWTLAGTTVDRVQDEDRPGYYSLTDANNIYGSDSAYKSMSQYSMGSARVFHANYDAYGEMVFTFYGTGFDVISMTNNKTGGITLDVYEGGPESETYATYTNSAGESETCQFTVDTYYGYKYENGEWVITDSADPNSLYQVPVIEVEGLPYGQYTVKMKVSYVPLFDHEQYGVEANKMGAYDFYLDAIRIYDPANDGAADDPTDTTIEDAYKADGEGWPSYIELRNNLITKASLGNAETDTVITGLVFIDGDAEVDNEQISDYVSYGPNNEVYLAPGQSVAFLLNTPDNIKNVHIGIKSADGEACTYTITNIAQSTNTETGVNAGDYYGAKTATVNTTTDMYYDLTGWKGDIIVISNTGDRYGTTGIISLTNIKSTYTSDPNSLVTTGEANEETAGTFGLRSVSLETASIGVQSYGLMTASEDVAAEIETTVPETTVPQEAESERFETYVYMTPAAAALVVETLNADAEEEVPGETEPEVTEPETTDPETSEPEITDPETSEPEITEPETTEPETTVPETTEPGETEPDNGSAWDRIWDRIWDLIGKIFG